MSNESDELIQQELSKINTPENIGLYIQSIDSLNAIKTFRWYLSYQTESMFQIQSKLDVLIPSHSHVAVHFAIRMLHQVFWRLLFYTNNLDYAAYQSKRSMVIFTESLRLAKINSDTSTLQLPAPLMDVTVHIYDKIIGAMKAIPGDFSYYGNKRHKYNLLLHFQKCTHHIMNIILLLHDDLSSHETLSQPNKDRIVENTTQLLKDVYTGFYSNSSLPIIQRLQDCIFNYFTSGAPTATLVRLYRVFALLCALKESKNISTKQIRAVCDAFITEHAAASLGETQVSARLVQYLVCGSVDKTADPYKGIMRDLSV